MGKQFCTQCGHSVAIDAKFCENCGAVFDKASLPADDALMGAASVTASSATPARETVVTQARSVISAWAMPFNATLFFGSTLVAVFDFLSPRVALLPVAATLAVVGLVAALALRKFVAPSLPASSGFRRVLAPEAGLHKSPVLIATGVLSALMVSGAAWSSAQSVSGGVIASKFDAARNAQMQLGLMQGIQKEQRVQTAVLEDIREGRAANPRRELANQGIFWKQDEFERAVEQRDLQVIASFLAGGMQWRIKSAKWLLVQNNSEVVNLLIAYPKLAAGGSDECESLMSQLSYDAVSDKSTFERGVMSYAFEATALTAISGKFLKAICADLKSIDLVKSQITKFALRETEISSELEALKVKARVNDCVEITVGGISNLHDVKLCRTADKELALQKSRNFLLRKTAQKNFYKNILSVVN